MYLVTITSTVTANKDKQLPKGIRNIDSLNHD